MSVIYSGDGITFNDGSTINSGWTGFKNRIINGDMRIDQRFSGSANTPATGAYTVDRWLVDKNSSLSITTQQVDDGPTGYHQKSLKITIPSGSVGSSDYFGVRQLIENTNFYDIGSTWGTANPASFTISFWVKSNLAGTYYFSPRIPSVASYCASYTINQANTWEYKSITVTGPTNPSYAPLTQTTMTAGSMISVRFWQIAGASESGSSTNTWGISGTVGSGMANLAASGGTWQITGVQVERGTTASSFDYRPYGAELVLCQRYYEILYLQQWVAYRPTNSGSGQPQVGIQYMTKRTTPSITFTSPTIDGVGVTTTAAEQTLTNSRGYTSTTVAAGFLGEYDCTSGVKIDAEL